ncbi:hypothetical protein INS49_012031 [Diaporthe citri]|uniref:uncharacterized protein n=1 Tax=Diaporthe citri TaxID=83186 RepID=UPI001C819F59|nr:uncharacterized protein INS49_012031 [Diaporthe citri]KAG6360963.1 hypothetical protein INS49_012031 [Diaporthe citri]
MPRKLAIEDRLFSLDGCHYVLALDRANCSGWDPGSILSVGRGDEDMLVTAIDGSGISSDIDKKWLEDFIREALTEDHVFNEDFLPPSEDSGKRRVFPPGTENITAYYRLSEPATSTAFVVQTLTDRGHQIVGLTKLSSMMAREEPMDAVDFQTAFNPRGDGYQSPAGSSHGSAAAVAAYDWLDCAIGTDTSGSGRRPALVNGVFHVLGRVFSAWLPESRVESLWGGMEVIYPLDYLPAAVPEQTRLIDSFVGDLATCFVCSVTEMSLRDSWRECPPDGADPDIEAYLKDVIVHTYYYSYYHLTSGWRDKHKDRFGHEPYVIPFVKQRWDSGAAVTHRQHEEGLRKLEVYRKWLFDTLFLFRRGRTLMVLPISPVEPHYRDERAESPRYQSATHGLFLSPILKAPDVVVPMGEIPYESRISGRQEWLPVGVNLVGAPGMDKWLFDAVTRVLRSSGRPDVVSWGSRIFRNRE